LVPEFEVETPGAGLIGVARYRSRVMVPAECAEEARAVLDNAPEKLVDDEPS
jgi:hypothetical protein